MSSRRSRPRGGAAVRRGAGCRAGCGSPPRCSRVAAAQTAAGRAPSRTCRTTSSVPRSPETLRPTGRRPTARAASSRRSRVGAVVAAEEGEDPAQEEAAPHAAEHQRGVRQDVRAGREPLPHQLFTLVVGQHARQRAGDDVGGAGRVEEVVRAGRAGADRGDRVVVPGDRQRRAVQAGRQPAVPDLAGRGPGVDHRGEQRRRQAERLDAVGPGTTGGLVEHAGAGRQRGLAARARRPGRGRRTRGWPPSGARASGRPRRRRTTAAWRASPGWSRAGRCGARRRARTRDASRPRARPGAAPRRSNQATTGVQARPAASRTTPLSAKPVTPSPRTRSGPAVASACPRAAVRAPITWLCSAAAVVSVPPASVTVQGVGSSVSDTPPAVVTHQGLGGRRAEIQPDDAVSRRHGSSSPDPRRTRVTGMHSVVTGRSGSARRAVRRAAAA